MFKKAEIIVVQEKKYKIEKLLGHGKGGYSYLAKGEEGFVVLKQIHHEPCAYYQFGNKIEAEQRDYKKLLETGIRIPKMLAIDVENERIVKEYIEGDTIYERILDYQSVTSYVPQVEEMAELAKAAGINIDYFPTNFVIHKNILFYIDYECNAYMEEWNLENWGIKYWSRTKEFQAYVEEQHNKESK